MTMLDTTGKPVEGRLFDLLAVAKSHLAPVPSACRVIFEDDMDAPAKVLVPDQNFMAAAMAGGILPIIDVFHGALYRLTVEFPGEQSVSANVRGINLKDARADALAKGATIKSEIVIQHDWHDGPKAKPMTEAQAIDYLIEKDIPKSVWGSSGNRQKFKVVTTADLPNSREHRNAWSM
jgi:hypothetical protein